MHTLLIVGAGGYGQLVREAAEMEYDRIDFLDDNSPMAIGKLADLDILQNQYSGAVIALGNPVLRERLFRRLKQPVSVIHPSAVVSKSAVVSPGCVVEAHAVINRGAELREGCFVCAGAVVNHDAIVSSFCQIDCNAVVESGAVVPSATKIESCTVYKR